MLLHSLAALAVLVALEPSRDKDLGWAFKE
jgi:hypothetical protein